MHSSTFPTETHRVTYCYFTLDKKNQWKNKGHVSIKPLFTTLLTMSNLCFFANTLCVFCFYFEPHISNTLIFLLMFSFLFTVHSSLVSYSVKLFQTNSTYLYSFQGMFSFFCKWITLTVLNIYLPLELYVHMYRITFGALLI